MADLPDALIKVIFVFNLALLCIGIYVIMHGVTTGDIIPHETGHVDDLKDLVYSLSLLSKALMIVGGIISVVSFLGCWGAFVENISLLSWYIFFLVLLIVLQISVGVYIIQAKETELNKAHTSFFEAMKKYSSDKRYTAFVDAIQNWLKCCGAKNVDDWKLLGLKQIPLSCCDTEPCDDKKSYRNGCVVQIDELVKNLKWKLLWTMAAIIGFQVVVIIITFIARSSIQERKESSY